jgi:hypothetical protein
LTSAKTSATSVTWKSEETIRARPGRAARDEYRPERAKSSTVTRYAKATVSRASSYEAVQAHSS